jgi:hypothetical protein
MSAEWFAIGAVAGFGSHFWMQRKDETRKRREESRKEIDAYNEEIN